MDAIEHLAEYEESIVGPLTEIVGAYQTGFFRAMPGCAERLQTALKEVNLVRNTMRLDAGVPTLRPAPFHDEVSETFITDATVTEDSRFHVCAAYYQECETEREAHFRKVGYKTVADEPLISRPIPAVEWVRTDRIEKHKIILD